MHCTNHFALTSKAGKQDGSEELHGCLQVAVMAPGVYEISDYVIRWLFPDVDKVQYSQPGAPFVLTVEDEI